MVSQAQIYPYQLMITALYANHGTATWKNAINAMNLAGRSTP
jgi:hypothetical protein